MDYEKFNSKLSAAKQIYGRVRRMERRAFKEYTKKMSSDTTYFTIDREKWMEMLTDAKKEELDALRKAAQELAYKALGYIFDYGKEFKLSKPRREWLVNDRLALIDCEIYEFNSAEYELKYDFNADKLVLVSKEFNEPISDLILPMWSLKHENVEHLLKIAKIVKNQLK